MNFADFNLNEKLLAGIASCAYTECTPVQEQVLKLSQDGADLYVQSQTGTGKTAAYLVSIIQEILKDEEDNRGKALIMVPTRELAVQVEEEAKALLSALELKPFSFYGGIGYEKQIEALKRGVDIIVGTPGRLIDLNESKHLDFSAVRFLVIDEADRMFDMGFYPDLRTLIKVLPPSEQRQTMLFSATLNSYVKNLAWEYTRDAKEIVIEAENITVSEIGQELIHVSSDDKMRLLLGILQNEQPKSAIVFCNTKRSCEVVSKRLVLNGMNSGFIIGDLPQAKRLKILNDFKDGSLSILVATDVAARGIDVNDLAMVINFDLPNEAENYVHRIGRTARAGKSGKSYTFCSEQDVYSLPPIERFIDMQIPSKVADAAMLAEDKSAGVYIRTEAGHERSDYASARGGFRSERRSRPVGKRAGGEERFSKRSAKPEKSGGRTGSGKGGRKAAATRPAFRSSEELSKMETLPFEERLKIYKEKYASPQMPHESGGKKRKGAKAMPAERDGAKKSRTTSKNARSGGKPQRKRTQYVPAPKAAPAPAPQKGIFARIKSFFSKK